MNRTLTWAVGLIVAAILALVGYLTYGAMQKRAQQRQVVQMVRDTTDKLRQALATKPAPELVAAIDANLKAARAPRDPGFADAAEHYILGAREIARRRVETERLELPQFPIEGLGGAGGGAIRILTLADIPWAEAKFVFVGHKV